MPTNDVDTYLRKLPALEADAIRAALVFLTEPSTPLQRAEMLMELIDRGRHLEHARQRVL